MAIKLLSFGGRVKEIFRFFVKHRFYVLAFVVSGVVLDILSSGSSHDFVILFLVTIWVLVALLFKLQGKVFIGGALCFLLLCPFLVVLGEDVAAEKVAVWVYIFLIIGTALRFFEFIKLERGKYAQ